jgi:hypothetical protein
VVLISVPQPLFKIQAFLLAYEVFLTVNLVVTFDDQDLENFVAHLPHDPALVMFQIIWNGQWL